MSLINFAYLDAGTGSLFIQAIIGGVVGGLFVFRNFITKVAMKLRGRGKQEEKLAADETRE